MSKIKSRIRNTVMSTLTGMGAYFIVVILGFVGRSVFIAHLNVELLGINGLFSSILQIFSLADLGFATAIGVALYKPLSQNDERKVALLMSFYAKVYFIVGVVVFLLGICLLPFLQYLIKDFSAVNITLNELQTYFFLFLLGSVSSYFFAYKKTLLISDQKKYIVNINMAIVSIIARVIQILIVIFLQSFLLYLIANIISVYVENIIASIIANRSYPYLKKYRKEKLDSAEKKALFSNIGALTISKLSSVFTTGIISIIITTMIGLRESGLYSNYFLVTSSIMSITAVIFEAVTASVGNFVVTETRTRQLQLFNRIFYFVQIWSCLIFVGLAVLFNDFIALWLSADMQLSFIFAFVMAINLYIWLVRQMSWVLYNAYGLYKHYYYRSFAEIIVFIILGFLGAKFFGITGIILAQIMAIAVTQFWVEVHVVSQYALKVKHGFFYSKLLKALLITAADFLILYFICGMIPFNGLWSFVLKILIIVVVTILLFGFLTFKTEEFKYYKNLVKKAMKIKEKKIMKDKIVCTRCVMTNVGDSNIRFDENGYCNYCKEAIQRRNKEYFPDELGEKMLKEILEEIKIAGKDKKYDCMMGISGGLDSSYLAYLGYKWGLRILGIHIDDGYDTDLAKENVRLIGESCKIDLIYIKPDKDQYNDLLLAFIKASVPNIAIPQDNILTASLYKYAVENDVKYFLSGFNFPLESILQTGNTHRHGDVSHIKAIARKFCVGKINKLAFISTKQVWNIKERKGINTIYPLNLLDYNKERAIKELYDFMGYTYYEAKHFESIFTRFMQTYYLPTKFHVDKRTSHLSSLVMDGQLTRDQALAQLERPPIREELLNEDMKYIANQLKISMEELKELIALPPRQHDDYHIDFKIRLRRILNKLKSAKKKEKS